MYAYRTGTQKEQSRITISGGNLRRTELSREFDALGMVTSESGTGDKAKSGDEQCSTTSYARNTSANILTTVAETKTVAVACGTAPSLPADLVSAKRFYYDGSTTLGAAPSKGSVTRSDENDGVGTGFITVTKAAYDSYGRQTEVTDAAGAKSAVSYSPATGQAPTETVSTNALDHTTKVITDPRRGLTTATVDANGKRTDLEYDALGRLSKAWSLGWTKADHPTVPSAEFSYRISRTDPNVVTTKVLNYQGEYDTTYAFYDGMLRPRQTQVPAIGSPGNRVVTETRYDTRGQVWKTYGAYYAEGAASATLVDGDDSKVPAGTETVYDGAGRATDVIALKFGDETKRTITQYAGDRTTVIPPKGGTATTTIVDALGRKTESRAYTDAARTTYEATLYAYEKHDQLAKMTDPAGIAWTWTYDARARLIEANDPDKGISRTTYDNADRPVKTTDARGVELVTAYDVLGRREELRQGSTVRAAWSYDTVAKGLPASDTRFVDGKAYTTQINSYDDRGQPTSSTATVPDGAAAGSYTWTFGYNQYNGLQEWVRHPALAGLPAERQTTVFGQGNLPQRTTAGAVLLVGSTSYDVYGRQIRAEYGTLGRKVYRTQDFDEHTGQLTRSTIDGDIALRVEDTHYGYDLAGNTTRISSTSGQDTAAVTDTQCFALDALRRMTEAWTTKEATDNCATGPSASTVGGPDAYWHSYTYDEAGNRTREVQHATGTGTADITRTYTAGKAGETRPHALRSITTTGGADTGTTETFTYDDAGNTAGRTGGPRTQDLTWDAEGHLTKIVEDGKTTEYAYDADGNRMLAKNADGSTTAYLPGGNELQITAAGAKTATRYYTHSGETVAVRTSTGGFSFLFGDHQGTALIAIATGAAQTVTRRKQLPFGATRSAAGSSSWPGDRGFVGGTTDPTGYTHLGAREYDPTLGRFLSVDPLLITDDPTQHNPYTYGNNNPATYSDPTGEAIAECMRQEIACSGGLPKRKPKINSAVSGGNPGSPGNSGSYIPWTPGSKKRILANPSKGRYNTYGHQGRNSYAPNHVYTQAQWDADHDRAQKLQAKADREKREKNKNDDNFFKDIWNATGGKVASTVSDAAGSVGDFANDHWRGIAQAAVIVVGTVAVVVCTAATAGVCAGAGGIIMTAAIGMTQGIATHGLSGGSHSLKGYAQAGLIGGATAGGGTAIAKAGMLMSRTAPYHTVSTMISTAGRNGGRFWKGGEYGRQVKNHMRFGTKWSD
ncbi:RHS repeat domain-containing protein [Streptomyces sp. NPDC086080]|uniref:RHS repeat domain-containing protein n=1 Tax=Streptomyces sp. NPDC086080 TaxID=3365748 RepID=UPI0037D32F1A